MMNLFIRIKNILFESATSSNVAVATFGRFNPPTKGHSVLIHYLANMGKEKKTKAFVFPSRSFDSKKNPLDIDTKISFLKKIDKNVVVVDDKKLYNPYKAVEWLLEQGYEKIYFIIGDDREDEFKSGFVKYYDKDKVIIKSSGNRSKGISGTDMRNAVKEDDFKTFSSGIAPEFTDKEKQILFDKLKNAII